MQRYLAAVPPGILVTAGLLWTMQALIVTDFVEGPTVFRPAPKIFHFTPDEKPVEAMSKPQPIDPPVTPPARPTVEQRYDGGDAIRVPRHSPGPVSSGKGTHLALLPSDGPLVHWVRVQPAYPATAQAQGLEGSVTVRFDVSALGKATNVIVVDSSNRVFESAAVRAARKFRFRPKVVDGNAVPVSGVTYRFRFEMDE